MADTNFSLIDLKALSEPACKLIEAVQSAVGIVYEPTRIRRRARAEADAAVIKLEGEGELKEVALRAAERIKNREIRRQQNIESILGGALQELPEAVSDEPVDEDWILQFFDFCQDVGNEEMHSIWSKLLAGEVAKPRTYSLRTLHTVKLLRKEDANLFTQFCSYVWGDEDTVWLSYIRTSVTDELLTQRGITVVELFHLQTLGLVAPEASEIPILYKGEGSLVVTYYGKRFIISPSENHYLKGPEHAWRVHPDRIETFLLSAVGQELAPICGARADEEYLNTLIKSLAADEIEVKML